VSVFALSGLGVRSAEAAPSEIAACGATALQGTRFLAHDLIVHPSPGPNLPGEGAVPCITFMKSGDLDMNGHDIICDDPAGCVSAIKAVDGGSVIYGNQADPANTDPLFQGTIKSGNGIFTVGIIEWSLKVGGQGRRFGVVTQMRSPL